jgi:hypothetical protein
MKVVKYKTNAFFSHFKNQPLPPTPWKGNVTDRPDYLLGGAFGRWQRQLHKFQDGDHWEEFLETIHQGVKRGCPRPDAIAVREAEIKHVVKMTTPVVEPPEKKMGNILIPWSEVAEDFDFKVELNLTRKTAEEQLRRTVRELFQGQVYSFTDRVRPFFPSTSANYIRSRSAGGALSEILEHPILLDGLRTPGGPLKTDIVTAGEEEGRRPHGAEFLFNRTLLDTEELEKRFQELWFRLLRLAKEEENLVEPVGLAESLKVRVITKGPPLRQTVLRSLRKFMHSTLRKHPVFTLIGTPVTEELMEHLIGAELAEDEVFFSGDFQEATDNIYSWAIEVVADELSKVVNLGELELKLLIENLTRHKYPRLNPEIQDPQTRGQLMGAITSFPVLCIINASTARWSMEVAEGKSLRLTDCKLLINGDDIGAKVKQRFHGIWRKVTEFHGLIESVGKTFSAKEFIEINSRQFRRKTKDITTINVEEQTINIYTASRFQVTKFVNMGLVQGFKRSNGTNIGLNDQDDPYNNLGTRARQLVADSPEHLTPVLMRHFLDLHKDVLSKLKIPWYLPEWIGGLGLPSGSWGGMTELDRRVAAAVLLNWKHERPVSLSHHKGTWRIWEIAEKRMPEPTFLAEENKLTELYDKVAQAYVHNLLFDSTKSPESLYEVSNSNIGKVGRAIRRNSKLLSPAYQSKRLGGALPAPLAEGDLIFQRRYKALPPTQSLEARVLVDAVRVGQLIPARLSRTNTRVVSASTLD